VDDGDDLILWRALPRSRHGCSWLANDAQHGPTQPSVESVNEKGSVMPSKMMTLSCV